jgi:hypothetical protein
LKQQISVKSGLTRHDAEEKYPEVDSFVMVNVKQVRQQRTPSAILPAPWQGNTDLGTDRSPIWVHT